MWLLAYLPTYTVHVILYIFHLALKVFKGDGAALLTLYIEPVSFDVVPSPVQSTEFSVTLPSSGSDRELERDNTDHQTYLYDDGYIYTAHCSTTQFT